MFSRDPPGRLHTPHKFEVFHSARPDHVRVKVRVIVRPKELVSFDPWHVGVITKRFQGCEQEKIEMSSALRGFKANIRNQEMILSLEKLI